MSSEDHQGNSLALKPENRLFRRYVLKFLAGRGGMGVVWCAWDERLQHKVALKFLPEIILDDPIALEDLRKETKRCLQLTHPNIVRIYDFEEDGEIGAIVMEFVEGQVLNVLKAEQRHRHFEAAPLYPIVSQLCETLTYAHQIAGIVHRDIKPANLILDEASQLKVTDFGIARNITDSVSRLSVRSNDSSGTPGYMSPQQALGENPSVSDDIYSIGATLYDLLTSRPPFYAGDIPMQILNKVPPEMASRRQELGIAGQPIPKAWENVITACLEKNPENRPQSAAEILEQLGNAPVLDELDTIALTNSPILQRGIRLDNDVLPTQSTTSSPAVRIESPDAPTPVAPTSGNKHTLLFVVIGLLGVVALGLVGVLYVVLKNFDGGNDRDSLLAIIRELQPLTIDPVPVVTPERDQTIEELKAEVERLQQQQEERDALLAKMKTLQAQTGEIRQLNEDKEKSLNELRSEIEKLQEQLKDRPQPPTPPKKLADHSIQVAEMIAAYTAAGSSGTSRSQLTFFAERVDFLSEGTLSKSQIAEESIRYQKRFPRRVMTITSGPSVTQNSATDYQVTTTSRYEFDDFREGKRITKELDNTFRVKIVNQTPLIVSIKNPRNEAIDQSALPATEAVARDFVKAYFADGETGHDTAQMNYYADSVYYFGGLRTRREIGEILDRYISSTPYRAYTVSSEPEVLVLGNEFMVTATVNVSSGSTRQSAKTRILRSKVKVAWQGPAPSIIYIEPDT
ncbi:MAG: serine/threonine protein kinase [Verrucomicrobiales bacterium]|jgi:serine/threonine protein kinase